MGILSCYFKLWHKEQFKPSFLGLLLNPFYFSRKGLYEGISAMSGSIKGRVLDVGCGQKPYRELFDVTEYVGLEIDTDENRMNKAVDVFYHGDRLPFDDGAFDGAIMSEVLEHIFNPEDLLAELKRVLKEDGMLLITTPFVWDEHLQPYDFARYSSFGLRTILEKAGFEIIVQHKSMADIRAVFQMLNCYLHNKIRHNNLYVTMLLTALFISPFNILGEALALVLPVNNDLYLDNIVLAKKRAAKICNHGA